MTLKPFTLSILILIASFVFAQSEEVKKAITFYNHRADGHTGLTAKPENINNAIAILEKAHQSNPTETTYEYLLRSYYFKAAFVVSGKKDQKYWYNKGKVLGEEAIKKYPENVSILYWTIANFGKWGEAYGIMASAKEGLADILKELTEKLIKLDPKFANGGGYRILGVMHYKVPKIPFITPWPSSEEAEKNLKKALAINPKLPSNLYYYAEFLKEEKRKPEAKAFLKIALKASPRKEYLLEDMWDIEQAKKLLTTLE